MCIWPVLVGWSILAVKITRHRDSGQSRIKFCVVLISRILLFEDRNYWNYVVSWISHDWVWYSHQLPRVLSHHSANVGRPAQYKESFHEKLIGNDTDTLSPYSLLNIFAMIHATATCIYFKHHVGGAHFQVLKSMYVCLSVYRVCTRKVVNIFHFKSALCNK